MADDPAPVDENAGTDLTEIERVYGDAGPPDEIAARLEEVAASAFGDRVPSHVRVPDHPSPQDTR